MYLVINAAESAQQTNCVDKFVVGLKIVSPPKRSHSVNPTKRPIQASAQQMLGILAGFDPKFAAIAFGNRFG